MNFVNHTIDGTDAPVLFSAPKTGSTPRDKRDFPTWHFPMVNDYARNAAIYEAIAALDLTGRTVFEIGTGAGLIAMYFARRGARHVYTCEMDEQLYELAVETVAQNGLSDKITVIHADSHEYIRSAAFDYSPDVIFTETLDCGVVGEGYVNVARDIAAVARPDTIILPSEVRQFGFMVSSEDIARQNSVSPAAGFDLSPLNAFSTRTYFPIRYQIYTSKTLSPVHEMRRYDYRQEPGNAGPITMSAYASGYCHGVVSYFHAQFGEAVVTNDVRDNCHWHQAFHPLAQPIQVTAGTDYQFDLQNDGSISLLNA